MVSAFGFIGWVARLHVDEGGIGFAEGEGIAVHHDFHGVAERGEFHEFDDGIGDESHVEEMLAALAFAFHCFDACGLADFKFIEGCHFVLVFSTCKNTAFMCAVGLIINKVSTLTLSSFVVKNNGMSFFQKFVFLHP